jgi:pimeloyl-ACP methyl ester carboxylesterase
VQRGIEHRFGMPWSAFEAERSIGEQPLLVIHDRSDREVPYADGMRHARAWPRGRMLETVGLGHRRLLADTTVIDAVADFLAGDRP